MSQSVQQAPSPYRQKPDNKPSKSQLLLEKRRMLKAQLADLHYGFVTRDVTLLSSSQTTFIRYGIDGRGRERARIRLLKPLNRTIDRMLDPENSRYHLTSAHSRRIVQLLKLRDEAELHHVIPVSLLPVDEAPGGTFGDKIAWWQDAAHEDLNLVSVVSDEHTLIHNYLFAQGLYSVAAIAKANHNISERPVIVKASIPVQPGTIWGSCKSAPILTLNS